MAPVKDEDDAAHACPGIASVRHIMRTDTRKVEVPRLTVDMFTPPGKGEPAATISFHRRTKTLNTSINVSSSSIIGLLHNSPGT
jgi:hypothetical protein